MTNDTLTNNDNAAPMGYALAQAGEVIAAGYKALRHGQWVDAYPSGVVSIEGAANGIYARPKTLQPKLEPIRLTGGEVTWDPVRGMMC